MKKRNILFNLLVFGILILGLHINANAQETSVPDGYTGIYNIADLDGIRNNPSGNYILMKDIDMTEDTKKGGDWDNGMGWTPIEEFSGVLDGNGHQIIGMNIYNGYGRIGFIRRLSGGIIRNLGLRDVTIDVEARNVGSLVGEVGRDYDYDGGNYDYGNSLIENCYCSGEIRNTVGSHTYTFYAGGLIGYMAQTTIVQNCFSEVNLVMDVWNSFVVGSLVGGASNNCALWAHYTIKNCYTRGTVAGTGRGFGVAPGEADCDNCFYLKDSISNKVGEAEGVRALTNAQMKYAQTFTGFDFKNTWEIDPYCSYPYPQVKSNRYIRVKSLNWISKPNKITYNQGDKLDLSGAAVKVVYEDGTDANIAVSNNMLGSYDMKKLGTQTIVIQYGGKKVSFDIDVKEIFASSIKLNQSKIDVKKGKTYQLKATVYPTNTTNQKLTWTSDDSSIATVNSSGKITAKSAGTTTIWVSTANGKTAKCVVNVQVLAVELNIIPDAITLKEGQSKQLKAVVSPIDTTERVKWHSSNPKIAKVDQTGKVTALKSGETVIYATTDSLDYWAGCNVRVKKAATNSGNISVSKTVIKKVSALKKKKALIKYKKVKGASNYQVQYSMKKNFAGAKTKTAKGTSLKVSGLKVKKKYYFRVRVCKKVNGKTYYSGWSNVKSVKAKK